MNGDEIDEVVSRLIGEALGREPAQITPGASLIDELGADSLDFLDIVFKLERAFAIQITRGEIEAVARGELSEEEFAPGGLVSERGLTRLRELMPEAAERIRPGLHPREIPTLFTARTFASIVRRARVRAADRHAAG